MENKKQILVVVGTTFAVGALVSYGAYKVIQSKEQKKLTKKVKKDHLHDPFQSSDDETEDFVSEF